MPLLAVDDRLCPRLAALAFLAGSALVIAPRCAAAEPKAEAKAEDKPAPRPQVAPRQARNFVGVGPILGFTGHTDTPIAGLLGLELTYVHYPTQAFMFGMGAFAQAQTVGWKHGRWAFGPQLNFTLLGVEIGPYLEEGEGIRATTIGLHASPFVSIGFLSAALRIGVPVGTLSPGEPYGLDLGLVCAVKLPIPLDGELFHMSLH